MPRSAAATGAPVASVAEMVSDSASMSPKAAPHAPAGAGVAKLKVVTEGTACEVGLMLT
jgi:hypothetical protein